MGGVGYLKGRKGQAAVIGGIIIISLVFSIVLPLILLYQRAAEYTSSQAIVELNFINEKLRESLSVKGSEDASTITVNNTGSTTVTLTRLWLIREGRIEYIVDLIPPNSIVLGLSVDGRAPDRLPPMLKPGSVLKIDLASLANPDQIYFYLESDRGVLHPREKAEPLKPPKTEIETIVRREVVEYLAETQFGPMTLWFYSFTYYNVSKSGDRLLKYPDGGLPGFEVPSGSLIAFTINVTNYDPRGRTLIITRGSYMKLYHEKLGIGNYILFSIKNVSSSGYILDFDRLEVRYGQSVTLVFVGESKTPSSGSGYVTIVIEGQFSDGMPLVQNIPAIGIRTK
ncbi:MAG: hypothetical protein QW374_00415 [Candidatus Bathyarchaeia archaeon]